MEEEIVAEEKVAINSPRVLAAAFFEYLFQFFRQTEVHDPTNQIFEYCTQNLQVAIASLRRAPGFEEIYVTFRGEQIYINQVRMRPKARQFRQHRFLLRFMRSRNLGAIHIPQSVESKGLTEFIWSISRFKYEGEDSVQKLNSDLLSKNTTGLRVESLKRSQNLGDDEKAKLADLELVALALYEKLRKFAEVSFSNLDKAEHFEIGSYEAYIKDLVLLPDDDLMNIFRTNLSKRRAQPLSYLAVDCCLAGIGWARSLGLPTGVVTELAGAAFSHVWLYVLRSEISFDPINEREAMGLGALFDRMKKIWPMTELQKLALFEWSIPHKEIGIYEWSSTKCYAHFFSRMIRIIAFFRCFTMYQKGRDFYLPDEAMAKMLGLHVEFDASLLKLFVNWMGIYPIGTFVKLRSGEIAQVFAAGSDPTKFQRPIVSLLTDIDEKVLNRPIICDLSEMNEKLGTYRKTILKSLKPDEVQIPEDLLNMNPVSL